MPHRKVIQAVRQAVREVPGWPDLRVLDLSCGEGRLLAELAADGCRTEGTHYFAGDYIVKHPSHGLEVSKIHDNVDLTAALPFADQEYDVVIATEVMEHLPQHVGLIAEVARILKPGGYFVGTTPNIHRLASRLQFLLTGQHELRSARFGWETPAADLYSTHYNPVYFPTLHTVLYQQGLQVTRLGFTKVRAAAWLLLGLYPLVALCTLLECRHQLSRSRAGGKDLLRWSLDWRMLISQQLMVVARKQAEA